MCKIWCDNPPVRTFSKTRKRFIVHGIVLQASFLSSFECTIFRSDYQERDAYEVGQILWSCNSADPQSVGTWLQLSAQSPLVSDYRENTQKQSTNDDADFLQSALALISSESTRDQLVACLSVDAVVAFVENEIHRNLELDNDTEVKAIHTGLRKWRLDLEKVINGCASLNERSVPLNLLWIRPQPGNQAMCEYV